jgi:hypothetical protein
MVVAESPLTAPAPAALLQSRVQRLIGASRLLSEELYEIFDRSYLRGQSEEAIRRELGLTHAQYSERHQNLMRSFQNSMPHVGS